jgi:hypothetical protein
VPQNRKHLWVGIAFIAVCVLIGVTLFLVSRLSPSDNHSQAADLSTPADSNVEYALAQPSLDYIRASASDYGSEVLEQCAKSDAWLSENGYATQDAANKFFVDCARKVQASAVTSQTAAAPAGCFGKWIYIPASFDEDVGVAVEVGEGSGQYRIDFSDYDHDAGEYSQNGRPGETKTFLGESGFITDCSNDTAELVLSSDGQSERTVRLRRFAGDPYKVWQQSGWQPESE